MNVFCITSTINVTSNRWSYINIRSAWSADERLEQTIEQLKSIRKYSPDSFIIFSEGSILTEEQANKILPLVNVFLNDISDKKMFDAIHISKYKGLGEIYELIAGIKYVINNNIKFNLFFKFGGRISLNENFNISKFNREKYTFNKISEIGVNTVLYTIPYDKMHKCLEMFESKIINDIVVKGTGVEYIFPEHFKDIATVEKLGVQGYMGITRHEFFSI